MTDQKESNIIIDTDSNQIQAMRILIAEDSIANQMVFEVMLSDEAYYVTIVSNGHEAVIAAQNTIYDIIFMDIHMPELDGIEATKKIRSLPNYKKVPIIALSSNATSEDQKIFKATGMDDYLAKPVVKKDLLSKLDQWSQPDEHIE